ncbi:MAG TPA: SGNH/GDSL hydrolase family protein [Pseudomonadales bacterium]
MKKRYWLLLVVFVAVLGWNARAIIGHWIMVDHWVALVADVDHRMKPGDFPDLNSDNIRSLREASSIRDGDFNIIVLGDSYVFGFLHRNADTAPPAQLEHWLREHYRTDRINVWNFGWTSSSPYLSLRLLKDIGAKYHPDLVILNLDMTDFKDDFFYRQLIEGNGLYHYVKQYPRLFFHIKGLFAGVPFLRPLHQRWFGYPADGDYFVTRQPQQDSLRYFAGVRESLDQINAYSRDVLHAPFVVMLPPRHWQYTDKESPDSWEQGLFDVMGPHALEPFHYFEGVGPMLDYPVISLLSDFRETNQFPLNFKGDSHWTPAGARFAAQAIARHCFDIGCFDELNSRFAAAPDVGLEAVVPELAPVP